MSNDDPNEAFCAVHGWVSNQHDFTHDAEIDWSEIGVETLQCKRHQSCKDVQDQAAIRLESLSFYSWTVLDDEERSFLRLIEEANKEGTLSWLTTNLYNEAALLKAQSRGYDDAAHAAAIRADETGMLDTDAISLTHPYNWLDEDEVESLVK